MFSSIRILALSALAGSLLAIVFIAPGGAAVGAVNGLLVGVFIAWGEQKTISSRRLVRRWHKPGQVTSNQ